jgi:glycosyltransferase involved in cell wall biosynthesis
MLRIVHIDTERTWRGGEAQVVYLARGLKARDHEQWIACPPGSPLLDRAAAEGIGVLPVAMRTELDPFAVWKLARFCKTQRIQVIHMHTSHAVTLGGLAGKIARVKVKIVSRRVDFSIKNSPFSKWKYLWGADRILAISNGVRDVLMNDGIAQDRIEVVPSGIDLSRFDSSLSPEPVRRELGLDAKAFVVGTVAHFADHKGHRYLVEAMPRVMAAAPETRWLLVGDGELRKSVEEQTARLGVSPYVVFTGFRTDIPHLLAAMDLFVLPSVLEGLGTSTMDAMAMGKPVVATRTGGIPEVVQSGVTGFLVPPKDPAALADAILRLIRDAPLRRQMGLVGRRRAVERFGADVMVERTEQIYRRLLERKW